MFTYEAVLLCNSLLFVHHATDAFHLSSGFVFITGFLIAISGPTGFKQIKCLDSVAYGN